MHEDYENALVSDEEEYYEDFEDEEYEEDEDDDEDNEKEGITFSGHVKCMAMDSKMTLWLGTVNSGLIKFPRKGRDTIFLKDNSEIPDNDIYAVCVEPADIVWIGTDNGLAKIEDGKFTTFTTENSSIRYNEIRSLCVINNHILVGYNHSRSDAFPSFLGKNEKAGGISIFNLSELK